MAGCMEGVKIVELGHFVAVPGASAILADWGAEVIKVEAPDTGDQSRWVTHIEGGKITNGVNYLFEVMNRNKKGITLNLKTEQGKTIMDKLVGGADVFMSNFQPNTLKEFQLEYHKLRELNPKLIYAALSGYGEKGAKKDKPGYDYVAFWANGGLMDKLSDPNGPPRRQRPGMGDSMTSLCIACGISAALFARERSGEGRELTFSLYNTAVWALQADIQVALSSGVELPYSNINEAANPLFNVYRTKDGRWLELAMLQSDKFWSRFCHATGLKTLEGDPRFESHEKRAENRTGLIQIITQTIKERNIEEWEEIFEREELFHSRVQTVTEVIKDPQAIENDFFLEVDDPSGNGMKLLASPVLIDGKRPPIKSPAPVVGQHTEEVLLEIGYSWEEILAFRDKGVL
jgi:crotonobetainyl-CoA:carnitine CoA-transferase CaiB-like acyl-CoA transferase